MDTLPKVFIGSTQKDLAKYRLGAIEVCLELHYSPIAMEHFPAMGSGATAGSKQKIDESSLYVGIFAHRYGHVENGYDKSVTEIEFDYAGDLGLERLCFLLEDDYPWPEKYRDHGSKLVALSQFKQKINTLIRKEFTSVEDFKNKLMGALIHWERRQQQSEKKELRKLIDSPETFSLHDIYNRLNVNETYPTESIYTDERIDNHDLKRLMTSIFYYDEHYIENDYYISLTKGSSQKRNKDFFLKAGSGFQHCHIIAEGDAWFNHPVAYDICDWLNVLGKSRYSIYSLPRGEDYFAVIQDENKYINTIRKLHPEVLLLSAGVIELVNGQRVALMINKCRDYVTEEYKKAHPLIRDVLIDNSLNQVEKDYLIHGLSFLTKEFFVLLGVQDLSYRYIIKQLRKKVGNSKIITHGYDYFIPSYRKGPGVIKYWINQIAGVGDQFKRPMNTAGINDPVDQRAITFAMVHLFNEMMVRIVNDPIFGPNVFHIDCRGYARDDDWLDEIHLKPRSLKGVAETYMEAIENEDPQRKVFLVRK